MTDLAIHSASDYRLAEIAESITRSFEGYFVPIQMSEVNLLAQLRLDSIDLGLSRIVTAGETTAGAALIARRGWTSRVAAMGIFPDFRNQGVGKFMMKELIQEVEARGDHEMVLEVIEQNAPAVHLYESFGFHRVRRLVGLSATGPEEKGAASLEEIDPRSLGSLISIHGLQDLPWQLSGETVAQFAPPYRAYHLDEAYALISDPAAGDVRIFSLLVEPGARHQGRARAILRAIMSCHPGRNWHVPAIFPEEMAGAFEAAGFRREQLSQWQMACEITRQTV